MPDSLKIPAKEIETWVNLYAEALFRRAFFLTSQRETAEDLVQETFLAAAQQIGHFAGKSSPKTWLFGILHHKTADHFRKKFRHPATPSASDGVADAFFTPEGDWETRQAPMFDWQGSPDNLLDDEGFQRVLQKCLDDLPTDWRGAFLMKFLEGRKGPEICQDLSLSPTNFWQIMHRTKLQLRFCLEKYWFKN